VGADLVNACIFCAGMLLGVDLAPRNGLGAELGFSYSTLARRYDIGDVRVDTSDVTPKFLLAGIGWAREAPGTLGAGTPEKEFRVRIGFATSHDEQELKAFPEEGIERIITDGTGRYENFALLARLPVTSRDSFEIAGERRSHKATDLVNIGGENQTLSEVRDISAERNDFAIGWRHRWCGLEAEGAFRIVKASGFNATANSFQDASGVVYGGEAEVRWRPGPWTFVLHGERVSGDIDVHRESQPDFHDRDASLPSTLSAVRLGVAYSWPRTQIMLTGTYGREKLPFVSLAPTGTETVAYDAGFDPESVNDEFYGDLVVRYAFTPAIRMRFGMRMAWGDETLTLTDSAGARPTRSLDILRRGIFGGSLSDPLGSPEFGFFLGADFAIGTPK
jgi:hypothetical protein